VKEEPPKAESPKPVKEEEAPAPMEEVTPRKEDAKSDDVNADIKTDVSDEDLKEIDENAPDTPAIHLYTKKTKTAKVIRRAWLGVLAFFSFRFSHQVLSPGSVST
jgi:hypothetical protein